VLIFALQNCEASIEMQYFLNGFDVQGVILERNVTGLLPIMGIHVIAD